jgi:hypothetical protein
MVLLVAAAAAAPLADQDAEALSAPASTAAELDVDPEPMVQVLGGDEAAEGDWPPVAALSTDLGFACTGTLVTPNHVLTAGHCAYGLAELRIGSTRLDAGGVVRGIAGVQVHPDSYTTLDLALVELDAPVDDVEPAVLADGCLGNVYQDGLTVAIAGFGATDPQARDWPDQLLVAETTVRDADCSAVDAGCNTPVAPGGELVAGGDDVDSCAGDSGGPLFLPGRGAGPVLVGITSRAALPTTRPCGDGGIYVRADAAARWLRDDLGLSLTAASCDNTAPRVEPPSLALAPAGLWSGTLEIDDDPGQGHALVVVTTPVGVRAWAVGDTLFVAADPRFVGAARFEVEITDDGVPPLSTRTRVDVLVSGAPRAAGCTTAGAPATWGLLLLSAAARRGPAARRRSG